MAQLLVVLLFGLIAVVATFVVTREVNAKLTTQRSDQETLRMMVSLRDELQTQYGKYWYDRGTGGTGLSEEQRLFALSGPVLVRAIADRDRKEHPGPRPARDKVVKAGDDLSALLRALPDTVVLGSPEDQHLVTAAIPILNDLLSGAQELIAAKQTEVDNGTRAAQDTGNVWSILPGVLLSLMTIIVGVIWWRIGRARSRLVTALEDAAVRLDWRTKIDQLTGLTGHATFQECLSSAVRNARRGHEQLSLVLIDLDHFKQVNDTFGHQVGDEVLRQLGGLMAELAGPEDTTARVGGEEFAWLMPGRDITQAQQAAEQLRIVMEQSLVRGARITLSSGVCALEDGLSAGEFFRRADAALYWAKAHGRNMTFRYSSEVLEELSEHDQADRLERAHAINMVRALARAVDAKDPTTQRHSERVGELARSLALELGWSRSAALHLYEAALVHDVGKIGTPDAILFKAGPLTSQEREVVQAHAALGAQIVTGVLSDEQVEWVRGHHERIDGTGYPDALVGDEIPEGARLLALADAFDAMASARLYSDPIPVAQVLERCRVARDTQFWGEAVDALERLTASGAVANRDGDLGIRQVPLVGDLAGSVIE